MAKPVQQVHGTVAEKGCPVNANTLELDDSLQQEYPLHIVGIYTPFEPLTMPGSRLLMTREGLLLEACNGVFHSVQLLTERKADLLLPYGVVQTGITTIDALSAAALHALVQSFIPLACQAAPKETMMLVVKAPGKSLRCIYPSLNETEARLDYDDLAELQEDEHIILDVHSHGTAAAYFSSIDNKDDQRFRGHLKTSYVVGQVLSPQFSYTHRWVSRGHIFSEQPLTKQVSKLE